MKENESHESDDENSDSNFAMFLSVRFSNNSSIISTGFALIAMILGVFIVYSQSS